MAKTVSEMTSTERKAKREADRDRKRAQRDREKLGVVAATPEQQLATVKARWAKNREALSPEKCAEFDQRVEESARIHNLLVRACDLMRWGVWDRTGCNNHTPLAYGAVCHPNFTQRDRTCVFYPDLWLIGIEEHARLYPQSGELEFHHQLERDPELIREIETSAPESFRKYGEPIDGIDTTLYGEFRRLFAAWYKANRNAGVCEQHWVVLGDVDDDGAPFEPDELDSWDRVDELVRTNPYLTPAAPNRPAPHVVKQPVWHLNGFESQKEYDQHLADLAREQKRADLQRAAAALSLLSPAEKAKTELLKQVRREW